MSNKKEISDYKKAGEEMGMEIISLKRQNAGLKGQNTLLRNQIKELQKRVEHYKALDLEGDELNEKSDEETGRNREVEGQTERPAQRELKASLNHQGIRGDALV